MDEINRTAIIMIIPAGDPLEVHARLEKERGRRLNRELKRRDRKRPEVRIANNLRRRLLTFVRGGKSKPTMKLVGMSGDELRAYLESKFEPGMTWENYGTMWHIDHIIPISAFENPEDSMTFENLQPLWAEDNVAKSDFDF